MDAGIILGGSLSLASILAGVFTFFFVQYRNRAGLKDDPLGSFYKTASIITGLLLSGSSTVSTLIFFRINKNWEFAEVLFFVILVSLITFPIWSIIILLRS